ncbi:MAG: NB-ARC domain-containing protein [Anaerolineae bacterium]
MLVDNYLISNDLSFTSANRQYALNYLLADIISNEYQRLRSVFLLSKVPPQLNFIDIKKLIIEDAGLNNVNMLEWSWLYCHYVLISYEISQYDFANWYNVHERTLRRYQQAAIHSLLNILVASEKEVRESLRLNRLFLQLPRRGNLHQFGRDSQLEWAKSIIRHSTSPHIFVTGLAGIGKSTFVEYLMAQIIDAEPSRFERLIWIDNPTSVEYVEFCLREQLLTHQSKVSIDEYVLLKRVGIVIDDISQLVKNLKVFENFLHRMSNAAVIMTNDDDQIGLDCVRITLKGLTEEYAYELIRSFVPIADGNSIASNNISQLDISGILRKTGGNPSAIILWVHNVRVFGESVSSTFISEMLCATLFSRLDLGSQVLWLVISLFPQNQPIDGMAVINSWPDTITREQLVALISAHVLEFSDLNPNTYTLSAVAFRYIQNLYASDKMFQLDANRLLYEISVNDPLSPMTFALLEAILINNWLQLDIEWQINAAEVLWRTGVKRTLGRLERYSGKARWSTY